MYFYLDGIIYGQDKAQLASGFADKGVEYIQHIKGSFLLFLIMDSKLFIFTDKVHSRKAYFRYINGKWHISNNIDQIPKQGTTLSPKSIACYLANGAMLNGLTLYEEIATTTRASVHTFRKSEVSVSPYWEYRFNYNSKTEKQESTYQQELEKRLVESVKSCCKTTSGKTLLSLSAGYDARGILGILNRKVKAPDIHCFSYGSKEISNPKGDAQLSKNLAEQCDYPHEIIQSFQGDYLSYLQNNAREGKCLSFFCDELDAWRSLRKDNSYTDVFVGDECFGWKDVPLTSPQEILDSISIKGVGALRPLKDLLPPAVFKQLQASLNKLTETLLEKVHSYSSPHDKKDYLYLDQRLNHVLMPARENFASQAGFVHNPFLDEDILEFMTKLPPRLRKDKYLFRKTINDMFPELFAIERATAWNDFTNHRQELLKNREKLIELIDTTNSRLDSIISPEVLITLLASLKKEGGFRKGITFIKKSYHYLRRNYPFINRLLTAIGFPRIPKGGTPLPLEIIVLRLLLIRIYLAEEGAE